MSPIAHATVTLPRPVSGADIIYAVRHLSDGNDTWFRLLPRDGGECTIGQASSYPYRHLIVMPDGDANVRPVTMYRSVEVQNYTWAGSNPFAGDYSDDLVIRSVAAFAQQLEWHFADVTA